MVKYPLHFKLDRRVNFSYFMELCEVFCSEMLSLLQLKKARGPLEQAQFKQLFCNLLNCFIQAESYEKAKSVFMKDAKQLVKFILLNIEDQIGFVTELLDNFIFSSEGTVDVEEQEQVIKFLENLVSFKIDDLVDKLLASFDCSASLHHGEDTAEQMRSAVKTLCTPGSAKRNPKMKLQSITKVITMLSGMIQSQSKSKKMTLDLGKLLHLVGEHLLHCPKMKFPSSCPGNGLKHRRSIELTQTFLQSVINLLNDVSNNENVESIIDLGKSSVNLTCLLVSTMLTYS
jgi:hypothetical protein